MNCHPLNLKDGWNNSTASYSHTVYLCSEKCIEKLLYIGTLLYDDKLVYSSYCMHKIRIWNPRYNFKYIEENSIKFTFYEKYLCIHKALLHILFITFFPILFLLPILNSVLIKNSENILTALFRCSWKINLFITDQWTKIV